ncbi:hypothetical protein [Salinifilum ghardaiensis]
MPRWMAGADEDVWHNPVSGGEHPRTACGKSLTTPVRAQRGDLPLASAEAPPGAGGAVADAGGAVVCPVCARKLGVDPVGERRTLRDARLQRALQQAEHRPYGRERP